MLETITDEQRAKLLAAFGGSLDGWQLTAVGNQEPTSEVAAACACGHKPLRYVFLWTHADGKHCSTGALCVKMVFPEVADRADFKDALATRKDMDDERKHDFACLRKSAMIRATVEHRFNPFWRTADTAGVYPCKEIEAVAKRGSDLLWRLDNCENIPSVTARLRTLKQLDREVRGCQIPVLTELLQRGRGGNI